MISRFYSVSCNLIITQSSKVPVKIYNTGTKSRFKIVTISPQDSSEAVNSTAFRRNFHLFSSRFLSFLPSRCKRSRAVPIMTYSTGTINKLRKVEASRPPKIAVPGIVGSVPRLLQLLRAKTQKRRKAVIRIGRKRSCAASNAALVIESPFRAIG